MEPYSEDIDMMHHAASQQALEAQRQRNRMIGRDAQPALVIGPDNG